MQVNIGVTNPYAIAELVAGKTIRWETLSDPAKELANILQVPEKAIFSADSPLLRPGFIEEAGQLKTLSPDETRARLQDFLKANRIAPMQPPAVQPNVLQPSLRIRLPDDTRTKLLSDVLAGPRVAGSSTPWQPANTEWVDKGDFFEDVGEVNDPIQGAIGNCYFIAAMSSVSWSRPYAIANVVRPSAWGDDEGPIHRVTFYKDGTTPQVVEVSERVPVQAGTKAWRYARSLDIGEIWPAVLEKAYSKWRTGNTTDFPDYGPTAGGDPVMACAEIIRGARHYRSTASQTVDQLVQAVRSNCMSKRTFNPMVAWTYGSSPAGTDYAAARVVGNHAYSILGWEWRNNEYYIVLRNPWGVHEATLDVLSGSWTSTGSGYTATMPLNTQGSFAMKASTFKKYFAGLGWAV